MYMNRCVKDAVARILLVDGAFENLKSWLLPDQKRGGLTQCEDRFQRKLGTQSCQQL